MGSPTITYCRLKATRENLTFTGSFKDINMKIRNRKFTKKAIELWGRDFQFNMVLEELAELAVAVQHYRRGLILKLQVAEEIADVHCVLELLLELLDIDKREVEIIINQKIYNIRI